MFNFKEEFFRGIMEVLDKDGELVAVLDVQVSWEAVGQGVLDGLARQTMKRYSEETGKTGKGWSAAWLTVEGVDNPNEPSH